MLVLLLTAIGFVLFSIKRKKYLFMYNAIMAAAYGAVNLIRDAPWCGDPCILGVIENCILIGLILLFAKNCVSEVL
jgi:hypothetical protein